MMARHSRFDLALFAVLALVMLVTRTHSLSQYVHLPDTSWASFFVAGYYIRSRAAFPALFLLAFAIDLFVIGVMGGSSFCFTPAYWMLVPACGVMWLAGRFAAARMGASLAHLPAVVGLVAGATCVAQLFSSGGFYFLGGRFAEPSLVEFAGRMMRYFPASLLSTLIWTGIALAGHMVVMLLNSSQISGQRR